MVSHTAAIILLLLAVRTLEGVSATQTAFFYSLDGGHDVSRLPRTYELEWPVKRVAIIGAGVGGLNAYRELKRDGFDVHVFERDYLPGGTWHFTEETPFYEPAPNAPIATADFTPSLPPIGVKLPYVEEYGNATWCVLQRRAHRAPKAIWHGLVTNGAAPAQQVRGFQWPDGTEWAIPQVQVGRYLRAFASWNGINTNDNSPDVSYRTRVELVEKRVDSSGKQVGWTLTTKKLDEIEGGLNRATWNKQDFDAVVVVSGRYNAPNIPSIEGLEKWGERFSGDILHSRRYRHPEDFAGKTVLIVGVASSGSGISREINVHAAKVYQSVKVGHFYKPGFLVSEYVSQRSTIADWIRQLPLNVSVIPEIRRFHAPKATIQDSTIELTDGTIIRGIDRVIFSTGFLYTYPFLPEYHDPSLGRTGEVPENALQPLVTDGSHVRSLHLDTFYIDNPTLAFININLGISSFTYSEFQSHAISMVWAGKAKLPARGEMWKIYRKKVEEIGYGKRFSFLGKREELHFCEYTIAPRFTRKQAKHANLPWDAVFSTELFDTFKPNAKAYTETARLLSVPPERCAMVAAHIWDLRAAHKVGMKTIYVPRPDEDAGVKDGDVKPKEEGGEVDYVVKSFEGVVEVGQGVTLREGGIYFESSVVFLVSAPWAD
ncbi:hypothetical protein NP233_g1659 [Leucocoprinus birnbaumii]|uniref:FAD/NAD(P)-binding domain-containing protein n=1 Tax=Leucocoprinus birnbaumii TaxID=56174 RepID=A0AAD5VZQ1_9AGAR|nr:hypothetical protein NP233_g1659 [Leucocoprinus birnbaumii]